MFGQIDIVSFNPPILESELFMSDDHAPAHSEEVNNYTI